MENSRLEQLVTEIVNFRDERDWKQFHNPKDLALSLMLESAEVAEHFQWKNKEEMEKHLIENKEHVSDELADVLYWVLLMSNDFDINILDALERKLEKNRGKYPVNKSKGSHLKYTNL